MSSVASIHHLQTGSFSLLFPLPFRILSLFSLGLFAWASNLHALSNSLIDPGLLLDIRTDPDDTLPAPATSHPSISSPNTFPRPLHLSPERLRRASQQGIPSLVSAHPSKRALGAIHPSKLYPPVYSAALSVSLLTLIGLVAFRILTSNGDPQAVSRFSSLPLAWTTLVIIVSIAPGGSLVSACSPFQSRFRIERRRFRQALRRIATGGLSDPPVLADILLADVMTSFARVFGDIWLSICLATVAEHGLASRSVDVGCYKDLMVPLMTSLPYAFRLRQCLAEYVSRSTSTPRRSLLNALKYASAFPMIILSVFIAASPAADDAPDIISPTPAPVVFQLWMLAVLVNSLYSFWWDVTNDWTFSLLRPAHWPSSPPRLPINASRSPPPPPATEPERMARRPYAFPKTRARHPAGYMPLTPDHSLFAASSSEPYRPLPPPPNPNAWPSLLTSRLLRPELLFRPTALYALLISLNLALRLSWTLRLAGDLSQPSESAGYVLEILEILRRWLWCFVRLEAEMVRQTSHSPTPSSRLPLLSVSAPEELQESEGEEGDLGPSEPQGEKMIGGGVETSEEEEENDEEDVDGSLVLIGRVV